MDDVDRTAIVNVALALKYCTDAIESQTAAITTIALQVNALAQAIHDLAPWLEQPDGRTSRHWTKPYCPDLMS